MKHLLTASRYLLAAVFIFSGFVKGVDPLGSAYKFHDYFMAFQLGFLEPLSLALSFALCAAELAIGLLLLFGVTLRLAAWGAFLFMLVFTPLTLFLAIFNPVSDCGCFGDAIRLTNWQTFYKNILFFSAALLLFAKRGTLQDTHSKWRAYSLLGLLALLSFLPSIHGYRNLPLYDFRPYRVGVNIHSGMSIPEGAPADEYRTLLYYQKDGVVKEFDESTYPWDDSTWTFVDAKSTLVKKGYTPPISNFALHTPGGGDVTDELVNAHGYTFLAVAIRLDRANSEAMGRLSELYHRAAEKGYGFACATATPADAVQQYALEHAIPFRFVLADEVTLKTVIRSNPGLLLLYNGTIVGKWHWRNLPDPKLVDEDMLSAQLLALRQTANNRLSAAIAVSVLLLLVLAVKCWRK